MELIELWSYKTRFLFTIGIFVTRCIPSCCMTPIALFLNRPLRIWLLCAYFHLNGKPRCVHVRRHLQFWSTLWSWNPSFIHFLKPRRIDTNNEVCYELTSFQILTKLKVSNVEYMKQNDSLLRSLYFFLPKSDWPFLDHWFSVYLYNVLGSLPYYTMCLKMTIVAEQF